MNYKRNNGFAKKEIVLILIVVLISLSVGFGISKIIPNNEIEDYKSKISNLESQIQPKDEEIEDYKNKINNLENQIQDKDDEIKNSQETETKESTNTDYLEELVKSLYNRVTTVYTEFCYDELNNKTESEIRNYEEVMYKIFTENGQKIFEKENNGFINIKNRKAFMTAGDESTGEYLLNLSFENIKAEKDTITATSVRKMSKEPIVDIDRSQLNNAESYTLKNDLVIKKVDGNWLVDKYSWVIQ